MPDVGEYNPGSYLSLDWDTYLRISQSDTFYVHYKDAFVLWVDSIARWVMLAVRVRTPWSGYGTPPPPSGPDTDLSDIVAWSATDPAFTADVKGPYWVVAGLDTTPSYGGRLWLGVPTALQHTDPATLVDYLYVYFVAEPTDLTGVGLDTGTYPVPTSTSSPAPPPSSILVRKVPASTFALVPPIGDEADWEARETGLADYLVPSEWTEEVRIWFAVDYTPYQALPFSDVFRDAKPVDPCIVVTDAGFTMFFATNAVRGGAISPKDGHGIWRASSVSDTVSVALADAYTTAVTNSEFGIDWIIRGGPRDGSTGMPVLPLADHVMVSASRTDYVVDPDAVRLEDGTWRVYFGRLGGAVGPLELTRGANTDVSVSCDDCWT